MPKGWWKLSPVRSPSCEESQCCCKGLFGNYEQAQAKHTWAWALKVHVFQPQHQSCRTNVAVSGLCCTFVLGLFVPCCYCFLGKICDVNLRYVVSPFASPIWENMFGFCPPPPSFSIIICLTSSCSERNLSPKRVSKQGSAVHPWFRHHHAVSPLCL